MGKNMELVVLDQYNLDLYITYLKKAYELEPDLMFIEELDIEGLKERINDPFFQNTKNILAIIDKQVVGRIEYHFYGCFQDGYRIAYVDWIYVLPEFRHQGVAQKLFCYLEEDCKKHHIQQYYLIRATNENANRFYSSFENVNLCNYPILTKDILE